MAPGLGADRAAAADRVTVTPAQLAINRRLARAALARSDRALALLEPLTEGGKVADDGWRSQDIRDGAVTPAKLSPPLAAAVPLFAKVDVLGQLVTGRGAVSSVRRGDGTYLVVFDRDISRCAVTASALAGDHRHSASVVGAPGDPNAVEVATWVAGRHDSPFDLVVAC